MKRLYLKSSSELDAYRVKNKFSPDILVLKPEKHCIKKEQAGEIAAFVNHSSVDLSHRMVLIYGLDCATPDFQNAMLKIWEESDADFLCSADNKLGILKTVRSRMELVEVPRLSYEEMKTEVKREGFPFDFQLFALSGGYLSSYTALMEMDPEQTYLICDAFVDLAKGDRKSFLSKMGIVPDGSKTIFESAKELMPFLVHFSNALGAYLIGSYPDGSFAVQRDEWKGYKLGLATAAFSRRLGTPTVSKNDFFAFCKDACEAFPADVIRKEVANESENRASSHEIFGSGGTR